MGLFSALFNQTGDAALVAALREGAFLVDVRSAAEYAQGSVRGAINIPVERVADHLGKFKGQKHIVVFCRSGNRSAEAKRILEREGFQNVINGGSWQNVRHALAAQ